MVRRILFGSRGARARRDPASTTSSIRPRRWSSSLAAAALIPLAWLIGEATEHAAEHTGPGIGGFLNATFGNAPELIIALLAVNAGLTEVVRGSLTGSVIGNLLLVLGFSLLFGGRGEIDRPSSFLALGLVAVATLLLLLSRRSPAGKATQSGDSLAVLSIPVSIALLVALRRSHLVLAPASRSAAHRERRGDPGLVAALRAPRARERPR